MRNLTPSPTYVTNITDPDQLKATLKSHIDAVLGRYGNDLYAFDVINERESCFRRLRRLLTPDSPQRQWHHQVERLVQCPRRRLPRYCGAYAFR